MLILALLQLAVLLLSVSNCPILAPVSLVGLHLRPVQMHAAEAVTAMPPQLDLGYPAVHATGAEMQH